ncbi:hypothetical protein EA473_18760 [Natrarchaeobius chitinivorans]|uniref:Halobacterial output domain-containing protein n=1 Tax=Natrarchaeobius chitinivorans TaxID=1679083 RepID=A0A3N6LW00_NATCH|nr:hypothetical protein EA473_18760 [Natrarchaeobius chitinivorans]
MVHAVVRAVATRNDVHATDLPPLYDRIDPDAMAALVDQSTSRRSDVVIGFDYLGDHVVVSQDGHVCIYDE